MSAHNYRGPWTHQPVTSAAASGAVVGTPIVEQSFAGIPETTAATNAKYSLDVSLSIYELPTAIMAMSGISSFAKGQTVFINKTSSALTVTPWGTATPGGTVPFGRVVAVNGDSFDLNAANLPALNVEPQPAYIWMALLPQTP